MSLPEAGQRCFFAGSPDGIRGEWGRYILGLVGLHVILLFQDVNGW